MVLDYFKLREQPFGVTPDARYLFLSSTHREALASLLYGVDEGCGFLALIASPGLGKTTLLFHALHQLREKALTVFLFQTVCTSIDLLRALLAALGVQDIQGSLIQLQSRLKEVLVAQARLGKRVVVVIDEAQNLDDSVLELIRMLSNFETPREKLIQIILSGQLELAEKIASPDLEQLRQRVSIFSELTPFSREDTQLYIDHRLQVAGYTFAGPMFTRDAVALIADASHGIPRNINNLCFNALSLACALQRKPIDSEIIRAVIADHDLGRFRKRTSLAPHSGASERRAVPAFRAGKIASSRSRVSIRASMQKFALALAAILAMSGVLVAGRWWLGNKAAMHAQSELRLVAPTPSDSSPPVPPAVSNLPSPAAGESSPAAQHASTVSVKPGETLFEICVASFGRCSPELLQEIRRLNPQMNNLDHIEPGQTIQLPLSVANLGQPELSISGSNHE
ncbi:MAG: AAA family ATPase [Acidobacteriaceae bacterium]